MRVLTGCPRRVHPEIYLDSGLSVEVLSFFDLGQEMTDSYFVDE
jgi:hypothetical protein